MSWILVGNPENRRVRGFVEALGGEPATIVPWRDVVRDPGVLRGLPDEDAWLRLDASGEDDAVARALLARGDPARADVAWEHGELVAPAAVHRGFVSVLEEIGQILEERPGWRPTVHPRSVIRAFDKRRCHAEHLAAGVRVPEAIGGVTDARALYAAMAERGWERVFVKLDCGSSASGLAVVGRGVAWTTTRTRADGRRFNSLRVQRLAGDAVDRLVDWLLAEGAHVELATPKARLGGANFDLRVLVVAGEPAFVVVRQSRHPITNLHLGGWRGDLAALRAACPPAAWEAAMADCVRVAELHGGLHAGVDVMFEPRFAGHRVLEVNAFGDLLPGLTRDGLSVYGWEIARADAWFTARTPGTA